MIFKIRLFRLVLIRFGVITNYSDLDLHENYGSIELSGIMLLHRIMAYVIP
jgi:hypothetical protein